MTSSITYFPRGNTISLFRQYVTHGLGRARTFARHGGRKHIRHFILPSIVPMIIVGFFAPFYWPLAVPTSGMVIRLPLVWVHSRDKKKGHLRRGVRIRCDNNAACMVSWSLVGGHLN